MLASGQPVALALDTNLLHLAAELRAAFADARWLERYDLDIGGAGDVLAKADPGEASAVAEQVPADPNPPRSIRRPASFAAPASPTYHPGTAHRDTAWLIAIATVVASAQQAEADQQSAVQAVIGNASGHVALAPVITWRIRDRHR
jgi:hypothetical protein